MTKSDPDFDADVLIVGTGPMGAATALALATHGIRVTAISRSNWLSDTPRAHFMNLRTMEVFRNLGVEHEVLAQATPAALMGETKFMTSLTGTEIARISSFGTGADRLGDYVQASPSSVVDIPQSLLEPIIVNAAAQRGATFEFNSLYLSSEQDDEGVTALIEHRPSGKTREFRARYLIGADGARSQVAVDAGLTVDGTLGRAGTVYAQFRGDLSKHIAHRPATLTWIVNQDAAVGEIGLGLLRSVRPWDQWIAGWGFDVSHGKPDLSFETARERIRAYVGDPDFEPEITSVGPWYVNEAYANEYQRGRILCGGDAMHRHPPSNGLGANTCIQDAFNLAWKLAYVLKGTANPSLLSSYTEERAPVGQQIVKRANNSRREFEPLKGVLSGGPLALEELASPEPAGVAARQKLAAAIDLKNYEWNALGVEMNQRYTSGAVLPDGGPAEVWASDSDLFAQHTTRPGAKLPHAWLVDDAGHRISTLDLVGNGKFTLITGLSGTTWIDAVEALSYPWLEARVIGSCQAQDLYFSWQRIREIDENGAILVRPDGVVAWRVKTMPADAKTQLQTALEDLLGTRLDESEVPQPGTGILSARL